MYTVEQAVRIALLENTSVTDDAIKSVVAAVKGLVEDPDNFDAVPIVSDAHSKSIARLVEFDGVFSTLAVVQEVLRVDRGLIGVKVKPADDIVTVAHVTGEPTYWIIERAHHPISGTHYKTVADSHSSMGCTVTPFIPRLK